MLQGMVVSNSILIVDFANVLRSQGHSLVEAVAHSCRIRLRPILMTSLATVVGLLPMAFKLETGSEAYAPLARVIIGGLISSIILTIFVVPSGVPADLPETRCLQYGRYAGGGSLMTSRFQYSFFFLLTRCVRFRVSRKLPQVSRWQTPRKLRSRIIRKSRPRNTQRMPLRRKSPKLVRHTIPRHSEV